MVRGESDHVRHVWRRIEYSLFQNDLLNEHVSSPCDVILRFSERSVEEKQMYMRRAMRNFIAARMAQLHADMSEALKTTKANFLFSKSAFSLRKELENAVRQTLASLSAEADAVPQRYSPSSATDDFDAVCWRMFDDLQEKLDNQTKRIAKMLTLEAVFVEPHVLHVFGHNAIDPKFVLRFFFDCIVDEFIAKFWSDVDTSKRAIEFKVLVEIENKNLVPQMKSVYESRIMRNLAEKKTALMQERNYANRWPESMLHLLTGVGGSLVHQLRSVRLISLERG